MSDHETEKSPLIGQSSSNAGLDRGSIRGLMERHGMGGWLMPEKFYVLADAIYKEGQAHERLACIGICEAVKNSGEYDAHQHYGIVDCRNKIQMRSNGGAHQPHGHTHEV